MPVIDAILHDSRGSCGLLNPATADVMGNLLPVRAILFSSDFKVVGPLRFLRGGATTNLSVTSSYQGIYIKEHATISIGTRTKFGATLIFKEEVVSGRTQGRQEIMTR